MGAQRLVAALDAAAAQAEVLGGLVGREWRRVCDWANALSLGEASLIGVIVLLVLFYAPLFMFHIPPYSP